MKTKKILLFALFLSFGLAVGCKSGNDTPRVTPTPENPQKPNDPQNPQQPEDPQQPDQPKQPEDPQKPGDPTPPANPPKPSDYSMAKRMVVTPIVSKTKELLSTLKIEEFAWGKEKDAIKLADLLPFVTFSSSEQGGQPYTLTAEDLKLLELEDMKYEEDAHGSDALAFKVRYKGIPGSGYLRIPISRREYFLLKFPVDEAFASKYYLGGMVRQFGVYSGEFLKSYDRTKYAVVLSEPRADHSRNSLTFRGTVNLPRYNKEDLLTLDFEVKGFKPLSSLKDKLTLATSVDLNEWMSGRLKKLKKLDDATILSTLQSNPKTWLQLASPGIRRSRTELAELVWARDGQDLVGVVSGGLDSRDVYLKDVRFQVKSAHYDKDAATVTIKLELQGANEQVFDGGTTTLVVRSVHL